MQIRSVIAVTAPNAQQEPQEDWSGIVLIDWHLDQLSLESNESSFKSWSLCESSAKVFRGMLSGRSLYLREAIALSC
jgi:hypothetical protein